jgi:hypothetical protein
MISLWQVVTDKTWTEFEKSHGLKALALKNAYVYQLGQIESKH